MLKRETLCFQLSPRVIPCKASLRALTTETAGELNVLGLDGDSLGVDGSQVGVFKETNEVGLGGFLEGTNGRGLESEIRLEVLGNLTNEALEGELSNEELSRLLVATDFSESDSSGLVSVGLLDTSSGGGRFTGSLGGELLSGSLSSSGLAGSLLGSGHL